MREPLPLPELGFEWSYPIVLSAMVLTAVVMSIYFFRKGWFNNNDLGVGASSIPIIDNSHERRLDLSLKQPAERDVIPLSEIRPVGKFTPGRIRDAA